MSLTKVSYAMITGTPANVLDFGADPTGDTDSTAAIQAAIAASLNVYFPEGTYLISSTLVIRSQAYWRGEGNVFIDKVGTGAAINDTTGVNNDGWIIENLTVRGSIQPTVLAGSLGIGMGRSRRAVLRDVNVQYFATGVALDHPDPAIGNYYNYLENVRVYGATTQAEAISKNVRGFVIGDSVNAYGANANNFVSCDVYGYNNVGVYVYSSVGSSFKQGHVELSENALILTNYASNNNFEIYCEASTAMGYADPLSETNNIWMYRDGSAAIFDDGGYNSLAALTSVEANSIQRNGAYQFIEFGASKAASGTAAPLFKITFPEFSTAFVDISIIAQLPSVNNYIQSARYACSYFTTAAVITNISTTSDGAGAVLSTSVSGNEITFKGANSAGASSNPVYRASVMIQGIGVSAGAGNVWEKIKFELI